MAVKKLGKAAPISKTAPTAKAAQAARQTQAAGNAQATNAPAAKAAANSLGRSISDEAEKRALAEIEASARPRAAMAQKPPASGEATGGTAQQREALDKAIEEVAKLLRASHNSTLDTEKIASSLGTDPLTIERLGQVMERKGIVDLIYPTNVLAKTQLKLIPRDEYADRAHTGIAGLDEQIEGGFERRSVVSVTGDSGSGKSTFCLQFLVNGAEKYGEPGIYITFEEKKEDVFRRTQRFGWDLQRLERENKLIIMEYPPHEIERFISEGQIIEDTIHDMGAKRVVIDSITSLALVYENEYKRRQGVLKTLETLKKWGCTALLTSESRITPEGDVKARFGMSYLVDGVIYLYNMRRGDRRVRAFEILKLRGTNHASALCPLGIENNGIFLYPNQPVFGDFGAGGKGGF